MAAIGKADLKIEPGNFGFVPEGDILEQGKNFSVRTTNSAKCNGDSEIDTRVNGCPVLLDFRKRVVYSSYTLHFAVVIYIVNTKIFFHVAPRLRYLTESPCIDMRTVDCLPP